MALFRRCAFTAALIGLALAGCGGGTTPSPPPPLEPMLALLAGNPYGPGNVDGTGPAGSFQNPYGVAIDSAGDLFVADTLNNTIREITPAGVVTTLAGSAGVAGSADGQGAEARFNALGALAIDC